VFFGLLVVILRAAEKILFLSIDFSESLSILKRRSSCLQFEVCMLGPVGFFIVEIYAERSDALDSLSFVEKLFLKRLELKFLYLTFDDLDWRTDCACRSSFTIYDPYLADHSSGVR
jgi:hypothetical protein